MKKSIRLSGSILLLAVAIWSKPAFSQAIGPIQMQATVQSFDEKTVNLVTTDTKSKFKIDRTFFKGKQITSGQSVMLELSSDEFLGIKRQILQHSMTASGT